MVCRGLSRQFSDRLRGREARAFDFFSDPLKSNPAVIEQGETLPGDTAPVACPVEKDFSKPLALGEATDIALCNNPQISETWADIKVQAGAVGQARAAYFPTISWTVSGIGDYTDVEGRGGYPLMSRTLLCTAA